MHVTNALTKVRAQSVDTFNYVMAAVFMTASLKMGILNLKHSYALPINRFSTTSSNAYRQ